MPARITVVCPECKKAIHADADVAGKKVRCKQCGNVFRASPAPPTGAIARSPAGKPPPKPAVAPVVPDEDEDDANPYQVAGEGRSDVRLCPECAFEMESPDAIVCLKCGYNTITRQRLAFRKVHDTTGFDYFMWLAPGIVCAVGALLIIVLDVLYCVLVRAGTQGGNKARDGLMTLFFASGAVKMWVSIACIAAVFFMGKFAYKRLLVNPTPPEIEHH
jgi:predicted Zn finger-like uncharacterized protein